MLKTRYAVFIAVHLSFGVTAGAQDSPGPPPNQAMSVGLSAEIEPAAARLAATSATSERSTCADVGGVSWQGGSPTLCADGGTRSVPDTILGGPKAWTSPEGLSSSLQVMLLLTVLSLAPAVLLMTTCFVRIVVVLSLLRQAIGTQNLPPTQVITTLSLFLTLLVMTPVWKQVYDQAVVPYTQHQIGAEQALSAGLAPIRNFMSAQIEHTHNTEDVRLFMSYLPNHPTPTKYADVPLQALLPAFLLSELKTAFLMGFRIYLPFVILDMVVASVMVSMGMLMLPPVLVSLPLKLLLFVLVDGWHLVVQTLLQSFQPFM